MVFELALNIHARRLVMTNLSKHNKTNSHNNIWRRVGRIETKHIK